MKYSFLLGSNAFFVDHPVITYTANGETAELLRIKSFYTAASKTSPEQNLIIDANITGIHDHTIILTENNNGHPGYSVNKTNNQIHVTGTDGHTVIDVLQLDPSALHGLSSHVLNEYNTMGDVIFIRLRGDFMIGKHRITIDNEKFFIDDDVYAESVQVGHKGLELGPNGVIL